MGINLINDNLVFANSRARYYRTANVGFASGANAIPYDTESFNQGGGIIPTATEGEFEVGFSGFLWVKAKSRWTADIGATQTMSIAVNGTIVSQGPQNSVGSIIDKQVSDIIEVQKNDLIRILFTNTGTLVGDANNSFVSFYRLADYSAGQPAGFGLASSSVAGLIGGTNGAAIPSGRLFESKEFTWSNISINGGQALSMGSLSLEKGNWLLLAQSQYQTNAGAPTEGQILGQWSTTGGAGMSGSFGVDYSHALVVKLGFTTNYNAFLNIAPRIVNLTSTTSYHVNIAADNTGTGTSALHGKATAIKIG